MRKNVSNDVFLEPITLGDQLALFHLMEKIYPPMYAHLWPDEGKTYLDAQYSKENLERELEDPNSHYYFVLFEGLPIGILKVLVNAPLEGIQSAHMVKLQRIYLDPSIQGKGLGKLLLEWVEKEYCAEAGTTLWLEAMDTQHTALGFYKKMGFEIVAKFQFESEFMVENYRGMYKMAKQL